jgi:hypothetical protein
LFAFSPVYSSANARYGLSITGVSRTDPLGWGIIHHVKEDKRNEQEPRQGSGAKEDTMNKVGTFFKNCWSDYIDFMDKYGEFVIRL